MRLLPYEAKKNLLEWAKQKKSKAEKKMEDVEGAYEDGDCNAVEKYHYCAGFADCAEALMNYIEDIGN